MRALLDVNVLVALLDADHLHHRAAIGWLERNVSAGWASCPITQSGCIRIMSQPRYPNPLPAGLVAERLAEAAARPFHAFWPDDLSLVAPGQFDWNRVLGSRQVTDAYLLALAVSKGGRFVTFDRAGPHRRGRRRQGSSPGSDHRRGLIKKAEQRMKIAPLS